MSSGSNGTRLLFWLKVSVSIGLIYYLFTLIDLERLPKIGAEHWREVDDHLAVADSGHLPQQRLQLLNMGEQPYRDHRSERAVGERQ